MSVIEHVDIGVLVELFRARVVGIAVRVERVGGGSKCSAVVVHSMLQMSLQLLQRGVRRFDCCAQLEGVGDELDFGRGGVKLRREWLEIVRGMRFESRELRMEWGCGRVG